MGILRVRISAECESGFRVKSENFGGGDCEGVGESERTEEG